MLLIDAFTSHITLPHSPREKPLLSLTVFTFVEKSNMEDMSRTFQTAYSAGFYDHNLAIKLYDVEITNEPDNFAAWNNRGANKVAKAIEEQDKTLAEDGRKDIEKAIELANDDYELAKNNLVWANDVIARL